MQALPLGIGERSLPLPQLAYVEVQVVVGGAAGPVGYLDVGRAVLAVPAYVHGQEVDRINLLGGEIVHRPNEPLAAVRTRSVEERISTLPVPCVWREGVVC